MAETIAVIAALPREIKALVGQLRPSDGQRPGVSLYQANSTVFVAAGMGSTRVSLAFEAARAAGDLRCVISVGLAGACDLGIAAGSAVESSRVVDVRTGERFQTAAPSEGPVLASGDAIASVGEKARLHAAYGAGLVDMEAATVARLARAHGVPFRAVKGISDPHDFELASLGGFTGPLGEFQTARFALHTALRPGEWRNAMTLGKNSTEALKAMTVRVREVLAAVV